MEKWCDQHGIEHVFKAIHSKMHMLSDLIVQYVSKLVFISRSERGAGLYNWYFYNHERPHMSVNGCPPNNNKGFRFSTH